MTTYTTIATTKGGRAGRAILEGGGLSLAMDAPKEMGGAGEGHNPEQLFALGYSSCFCQSVMGQGRRLGIDASAARVTCIVHLDKDEIAGPYDRKLRLELKLTIPGVEKDKAETLLHAAHERCPYSKAIKGNVDVTLSVV